MEILDSKKQFGITPCGRVFWLPGHNPRVRLGHIGSILNTPTLTALEVRDRWQAYLKADEIIPFFVPLEDEQNNEERGSSEPAKQSISVTGYDFESLREELETYAFAEA